MESAFVVATITVGALVGLVIGGDDCCPALSPHGRFPVVGVQGSFVGHVLVFCSRSNADCPAPYAVRGTPVANVPFLHSHNIAVLIDQMAAVLLTTMQPVLSRPITGLAAPAAG